MNKNDDLLWSEDLREWDRNRNDDQYSVPGIHEVSDEWENGVVPLEIQKMVDGYKRDTPPGKNKAITG